MPDLENLNSTTLDRRPWNKGKLIDYAVSNNKLKGLPPLFGGVIDVSDTWLARADPQASAMGFDDRTADCQPHSHAVGLCRVEWFKET